jgi:hypothetical protein
MVALQDNYDIAVVVSGDADSIPSVRHMKSRGKHIAAQQPSRDGHATMPVSRSCGSGGIPDAAVDVAADL